MASKPEIQYIGQFYIHGSEAKAPKIQQEPKKSHYELPLHRFEKVQKVHVDPLAICSLALAIVMLVCLVSATLQMQSAWQTLDTANQYVYELEAVNRQRMQQYRSSYTLDEIRAAAATMGLIPVAEAKTLAISVTVPEPEQEPTMWDDIVWFMEGLFA